MITKKSDTVHGEVMDGEIFCARWDEVEADAKNCDPTRPSIFRTSKMLLDIRKISNRDNLQFVFSWDDEDPDYFGMGLEVVYEDVRFGPPRMIKERVVCSHAVAGLSFDRLFIREKPIIHERMRRPNKTQTKRSW
jgi:hypothetical protein